MSDQIDHSLKDRHIHRLEQHMGGCPECRSFFDDLLKIKAETRSQILVEPLDDVWARIQASLKEKTNPARPSVAAKGSGWRMFLAPMQLRYAAGAAMLLIVAVTVFFLWSRYSAHEMNDPQRRQQAYALSKLTEAKQHYELALKALDEAAHSGEIDADPKVVEVFTKNLALIDSMIQTCEKTTSEHPDNIESRHFLLAAYESKLKLLVEMAQLSAVSQ